jgi:hypothetical protein
MLEETYGQVSVQVKPAYWYVAWRIFNQKILSE